jgi:mannose-6-phosphate isomerase
MLDSFIKDCQDYLFNKLLSQWLKHGIHPEIGYSYESLNHDWSVNHVGRIRLLTQCRQLYTFSHAYIETKDKQWLDPIKPLFNFIVSHYWIDDTWIFSLNDDLSIKDKHSDCYTLAFVLLAFSYYFKATNDKQALEFIEHTHLFLQDKMACENGGFLEEYPRNEVLVRRQNPHMHLLEGYLAAYKVTHKKVYKNEIKKLLNLMAEYFYDMKSNNLIEYFNDDWSANETLSMKIEPGHHFEWVWLLHQTANIFPEESYLDLAEALWSKARRYGFDSNGGIYNQIHAETGLVLDPEKRIWPITEYMKALCAHKPTSPSTHKELTETLEFLFAHYLKENGSWNEYLDANNMPKPHHLPGTTNYHIFLGLVEVLNWSKTNL